MAVGPAGSHAVVKTFLMLMGRYSGAAAAWARLMSSRDALPRRGRSNRCETLALVEKIPALPGRGVQERTALRSPLFFMIHEKEGGGAGLVFKLPRVIWLILPVVIRLS